MASVERHEHLGPLLVAQDRHQCVNRPRWPDVRECRHERRHAVGIVRHVEEPLAATVESSRHACPRKRRGRLHRAMAGARSAVAPAPPPPPPRSAADARRPVPTARSTSPPPATTTGTSWLLPLHHASCRPHQHSGQGRIRLADDKWHARFRDPRLLRGDLLHRVAEILLVIERDVRHRAHERRDHVGAVEPAAEADLDHGDVHLARREVRERDRRRRLEERGIAARRSPARVATSTRRPPPPKSGRRRPGCARERRPGAARCTAPRAARPRGAPRRRASRRFPCRWCRRREWSDTGPADCRARPAARAWRRGRT